MARGQLRIYLGSAPGVGKTYAMLGEGRRRLDRGTDVVVAWVDTHGRASTAAQLEGLEVVPRKKVPYRGADLEEMDLDAVLARRPAVALVDELAHTNVPGSRHTKRWQDIEALLDEGIDVISTVNIQHLESLNDVVERITGITQRETVPDEWVRRAGQIELVDMTPEALRRRMAHGNIYPTERIDAALGNYFRPGNLAALRELALLWLADRVEEGLQGYMEAHGIDHAWETRERVVVTITGAPGGEALLRRAARIAQRSRGELTGIHVLASDGLAARDDTLLERHRQLLVELGGRYAEVVGDDVAEALVAFARAERATQLVLGASGHRRWRDYAAASVVTHVIRAAGEMDVHVISTKRLLSPAELPTTDRRRRTPGPSAGFSRRRWVAAWVTLAVGLPLLTALLVPLRDDLSKSTVVLLFLLPVLLVTALGGTVPGLATAAAALVFDIVYFIPPYGTLRVSQGEDVLALVVFLVVSVALSTLFGRLARRSAEARQARAEAEALARLTVEPQGDDALTQVVDELRLAFRLGGVGVFTPDGDGDWNRQAASGDRPPSSPDEGEQLPLGDDEGVLVVVGARLSADDRRVLQAFAARVADMLEDRRLRAELRQAETRRQGHGLKTALLRAVSHDLSAPLASIRASVASVEGHLDQEPAPVRELVRTVAVETERMDALVHHLRELSRLDGDSIEPQIRAVALAEVVQTALLGVHHDPGRVTLHVAEDLPRVLVDPAFLAHAIGDVVTNALAWSPVDEVVRIEAGAVGAQVHLRVVDRGPVLSRRAEAASDPWPLPGDEPAPGDGLRPGLTADRELLEALGADLVVEETPGGGVTVVIALDASVSAEPVA